MSASLLEILLSSQSKPSTSSILFPAIFGCLNIRVGQKPKIALQEDILEVTVQLFCYKEALKIKSRSINIKRKQNS